MRYHSDSSTVGWECEVCTVGVRGGGGHSGWVSLLERTWRPKLSTDNCNCLSVCGTVQTVSSHWSLWTISLTFTAGIFAIFGQIERHLQHANWPLDKSISKRCQKQHCGCSTPAPAQLAQHLHFGTRQRGVRSAKGLNYRKSGFGATVQLMAYGLLYIDLPSTVFIVYHISNTQKLCVLHCAYWETLCV